MTYLATIIKPDGSREVEEFGKKPDYRELQRLVDGLIEPIELNSFEGKRSTAYVNEEGLLLGLPYNAYATGLWRDFLNKKYGAKVIDQKRVHLVGKLLLVQKVS